MRRFAPKKKSSALSSNNQLLALMAMRPMAKKKPKYGNEKTKNHDSKKESRRSAELKLLLRIGDIHNLREQVPYILIPAQRDQGGKLLERQIKYIADFVYEKNGKEIVEDAKGMKTQVYIIKRKLMLHVHGIRIVEV